MHSGLLGTRRATSTAVDAFRGQHGALYARSPVQPIPVVLGASPDRGLGARGAVVMHRFPRQDSAVPPVD